MLRIEAEGRGQVAPLYERKHRVDAAKIVANAELTARRRGHVWTEGQLKATIELLLSPHAVTGIQGAAGTAKTTTVLKTYADAARSRGLAVRAFAPTATAADVLARAINAEPVTVAKLLASTGDDVEPGREAWIVDEASMLSARDAARLLACAQAAQARLILVGDVAQLGSVEAGRSFGQLQEAGMPTHVLDQIVRQTTSTPARPSRRCSLATRPRRSPRSTGAGAR